MPFVALLVHQRYTEQADPVEVSLVLILILACSLAFHAINFKRSSYTEITFLKIKPV